MIKHLVRMRTCCHKAARSGAPYGPTDEPGGQHLSISVKAVYAGVSRESAPTGNEGGRGVTRPELKKLMPRNTPKYSSIRYNFGTFMYGVAHIELFENRNISTSIVYEYSCSVSRILEVYYVTLS